MNGVINLYKDSGQTSFAAVSAVRKLSGGLKCGHLGTLDPMAEGVLPVCLGYATRFADYLSCVDKEYMAQFKLGISTDSFDSTGSILSENSEIQPTFDEIKSAFSKFQGELTLPVPAFSAKKINGVRAYKLARQGAIETAGTAVMNIASCEILHYDYPFGLLQIACGKGTYIRSIISEAGKCLGCGAVMSGLVRTVNGPFKAADSFHMNQLEELASGGNLAKAVIPVTELLDWGRAVVKDDVVKSVGNGASPSKSGYLSLPLEEAGDNFFLTDKNNNVLATALRVENSAVPLKINIVIKE